MIAKGLHFPNVTLVGFANADLSLHLPDFRAGERTFQLLTQVAGRAGRHPASVCADIRRSVRQFSLRGTTILPITQQELEFRSAAIFTV
jgi:primosomal protein N'